MSVHGIRASARRLPITRIITSITYHESHYGHHYRYRYRLDTRTAGSMALLLRFGALLLLLGIGGSAFHAPRLLTDRPSAKSRSALSLGRGSAAKPFEKKKIAVFGAGGYLGSILYGYLQRAASLYGTGIAGVQSPRAIGSTATTATALNKELASKFQLAFCSEDLIRLVNILDADHIRDRILNFDAAVIGTTYQLEQRSVTLNTYEVTPNDKAFEIYLDDRYGAKSDNAPLDDDIFHSVVFQNSIRACIEAGLSHVVVIETPRTVTTGNTGLYLDILESQSEITYTYIKSRSPLGKDITYSFEKGINSLVEITSPRSLSAESADGAELKRETLAAIAVQALQSCDWKTSRILEVEALPGDPPDTEYEQKRSKQNFSREWCPNSHIIAEKLELLQVV